VCAIALADSRGGLGPGRDDLDEHKRTLVDDLSLHDARQTPELIADADVLIGLSVPEAFSVDDIERMARDAIVLALANPEPEVDPGEARQAGAAVVATGRSDFPNQVNNVLAFPGLFRGALDGDLGEIDQAALLRAAEALAGLVREPDPESILPSVLDDRVVRAVAAAICDERRLGRLRRRRSAGARRPTRALPISKISVVAT
jgi:malate dehydrogenase (oxaloacetate-decarboxylating)